MEKTGLKQAIHKLEISLKDAVDQVITVVCDAIVLPVQMGKYQSTHSSLFVIPRSV
jgi:hypothetical protein